MSKKHLNELWDMHDFRVYRPAAVVVFDLVKHSTRTNQEINIIQKEILISIKDACHKLNVKDDNVNFNYTGDGYVCALIGDESTRIIEFMNILFNDLEKRLNKYMQAYRAGADFGLIHLKKNDVTQKIEHFGIIGINASRLEGVAEPNQILCTENFAQIFLPYYQIFFSDLPENKHTKDRDIKGRNLELCKMKNLHDYFHDIFFYEINRKDLQEYDKKVLLVDDETWLVDMLKMYFEQTFPSCKLEVAMDGATARDLFCRGKYFLLITDVRLPDETGIDLTRDFSREDPDLVILVITGYATSGTREDAFIAGCTDFLAKPLKLDEFKNHIIRLFENDNLKSTQEHLKFLCPNPGELFIEMNNACDNFEFIKCSLDKSDTLIGVMLRHKAKQLVADFINSVYPGMDLVENMKCLAVQLSKIYKLSKSVKTNVVIKLKKELEDISLDLQRLYEDIDIKIDWYGDCGLIKNDNLHSFLLLIISELIGNSISALEKSGKINVKISILEKLDQVSIAVSDNGPGIPKNKIDNLFKEGNSTKGKGRGLGLYLIKCAIEQMNGEIEYELCDGALFKITIPIN